MLAKALQGAALATIPAYIEDTFATYLYTGNGSTQTITNGIDLSGKGGLVWIKKRSSATGGSNLLLDTLRGGNKWISSNSTNGESTSSQVTFGSSGFDAVGPVDNAATYASWTFRKQAKFFDVVTWSGNSTAGRTITHNLGSVPGCIIVKCTSNITDWAVYHRSLSSAANALQLNTTGAQITATTYWNSTAPTSSVFTVGADNDVNATGRTYVAYLFAHDAGGFGAAGTDNVISCGTYNGNSTTNSINLGYEPQWLLIKRTTVAASDWVLLDNMRGLTVGTSDAALCPNNANAEAATLSVSNAIRPTATGFDLLNANSALNVTGSSYIYIAIRRGPMRTPTSGTSVYQVYAASDSTTQTVGFPTDMFFDAARGGNTFNTAVMTRLQGPTVALNTSATSAENTGLGSIGTAFQSNTTFRPGIGFNWWCSFRRAPGFFDVVCYTGTGSATTITHNLASVPELMIVKTRSTADFWYVYHKDVGNTKYLQLQSTSAPATSSVVWNNTTPTSSVFSVGVATNGSGVTHVAYLFATVAGVSKVGSYTGNGSNQTINCGFTAGARFIMIKRTDSTGDWYVWDTARGIVSGNDPHLSLNTTAAEVTTNDTIDPDNSGFIVNQVAATNVNVNNATYIFLAVS